MQPRVTARNKVYPLGPQLPKGPVPCPGLKYTLRASLYSEPRREPAGVSRRLGNISGL